METSLLTLLAICAIGLLLYLTPSIIALKQNHSEKVPIILVNIFLGGTIIGWLVALLWSLTDPEK